MLSDNEKRVLQELGKKYMEIATLPIQDEKIRLWKALNRNKMERPMVVLDQLPWNELQVGDELVCVVEDPFWRSMESHLRAMIYKWTYFPVDMVFEPFIGIPKAIHNSGFGIEAEVERIRLDETNDVAAQHFINVLEKDDSLNLFRDMIIAHDEKESQRRLEEAKQLFEGIAPVMLRGMTFNIGTWDYISMLMGVENIYMDLYDRPEFIHAVLDKMTNSIIAGVQQCNDLKLHDDTANTCHCSYIYTDDLLPTSGAGQGSISQNCWAFGLAQLFSSCSPEITKEFEIPYVSRIAEHFGRIYYGCCDRLDDRLDLVKMIPNVRKVSCSPWSDKTSFSEKIGKNLIISNKPNPAFVGTIGFDEDIIRKDLEESCRIAKANGANLEFILKDVSTIQYDPKRLTRWHEIAMDVVNNF